jgi:hypothetical protein
MKVRMQLKLQEMANYAWMLLTQENVVLVMQCDACVCIGLLRRDPHSPHPIFGLLSAVVYSCGVSGHDRLDP